MRNISVDNEIEKEIKKQVTKLHAAERELVEDVLSVTIKETDTIGRVLVAMSDIKGSEAVWKEIADRWGILVDLNEELLDNKVEIPVCFCF